MKRICIVGSGAAGLLLLLNFEKHNVDPSCITVIDPTHTGGDLRMKWSSVRSNTTWRQICEAIPSSFSSIEPWNQLQQDEPVELKLVIEYLQMCTQSYRKKISIRTDSVKSVRKETEEWNVFLQHSKEPLKADLIFFCQGSDPKSLDLPFPSIPLDIALDSKRLPSYVVPGQHILLFGTAHSGPLVVKNLVDIGCKVTNFYATDKPFYFDRDGDYDGIKKDAEVIADSILANRYPNVSLESVRDLPAIMRATKVADLCVYACGFEARVINPEWKQYDGFTGRIEGTTTAWGFGIAFPNRAPDGIHWDDHDDSKSSGQSPNKPRVYWDVSVPAFQAHIQKQMPDILATLQ